MSDREPKSDPPPPSAVTPPAKRAPASADSRPGFTTMPNDIRAFTQEHPHAMKLEELPGATDAADKLREAGRGPDVLFEDLRAERPRDPSTAAEENRSEHVIVEMPGGVSPWVKDARAAKDAAAVTIDKAALPSASSPAREATRPARATRAVTPAKKAPADRHERRWLLWVGLAAAAVLLVVALRPRDEPGSRDDSTTGAATAVQATGMTAATTAAAMTGAPIATGAPAVTGAAPMVTSSYAPTAQAPATNTASTTKPAPKRTSDPFVDAGAPPTPPASAEPSVAPAATTAPPAPSSAPSSSSSTPIWFPKSK
jgi:hypothetical protein